VKTLTQKSFLVNIYFRKFIVSNFIRIFSFLGPISAMNNLVHENFLNKICKNADLKEFIGEDLFLKLCTFARKMVEVVRKVLE
jgi:hypothetical protein